MQKKILIVAPHPDDEILGCGGMIAKYSSLEAYEFYTLILSAGANTRYPKKMEAILKQNAKEANRAIGVKKVYFEKLPNQELDSIPLTKVIKTIEKYFELLNPDIVFTSAGSDLNKDHQVVYESTITACRPYPEQNVKKLYTYYIASSSDWGAVDNANAFVPNVFIDIEKTIDMKATVMEYYKSECREYPHPRSPKSIKNYAKFWGNSVGMKYAEPFKLIRSIGENI